MGRCSGPLPPLRSIVSGPSLDMLCTLMRSTSLSVTSTKALAMADVGAACTTGVPASPHSRIAGSMGIWPSSGRVGELGDFLAASLAEQLVPLRAAVADEVALVLDHAEHQDPDLLAIETDL